MSGYSSATFTTAPRTAFINGVAAVAGVPSTWVTITGVVDASTRRRRILGAAVSVTFAVQTYSGSAATAVAATLVSASGSSTMLAALTSSFGAAGLTPPTGTTAIPASAVNTAVPGSTSTTVTKKEDAQKLGLGLGLGLGLVLIGSVMWRFCLRPKAVEEGQKSAVMMTKPTPMSP